MAPEFPPRVFFDEFGPTAFCISFVYWYSPPDRWEFKAFGSRLNFEIFRAFEAEGIQFSLPLRHSYWKQDDQQGPLEIEFVKDESNVGYDVKADHK